MTPRQVVLKLLSYKGVESLDPDENANSLLRRGLTDLDRDSAIACYNAAMQELFDDAPASISERSKGAVLRAPTSVSFTATQYSTTIIFAGYQSWMEGCTVRISGDDLDNRILSATELMRPFMGGTGSVGGTVYADCIPLDSTIRAVLDPVELPNNIKLAAANSAEEFRAWNATSDNLRTLHGRGENYSLSNKSVGEPCVYFADSSYNPATGRLPIYLRFNPMPGQAYPVSFRARIKPTPIVLADIDNGDHTTDPASVIPLDWVESVLLPYALQRWLSEPGVSVEPSQESEIRRQARAAKAILEGFQPAVSSRTRAQYHC